MRILMGMVALLLLFTGVAGAKTCIELAVDGNSATTAKVFEARGCQGGGVTWAALVREMLRKRGPLVAVPEGARNMTGAIYRVAGTLVGIDDEGDAVRVCSSNKVLVTTIRQEWRRLDRDAAALAKALDAADPKDTECFDKKH